MKKIFVMGLVVIAAFSFGRFAFAEASAAGVAGCSSVAVDPESSLEFQQNVCNAAEHSEATSCGAGGHGTCSSPKFNDTMPGASHCICISEETEEVLA